MTFKSKLLGRRAVKEDCSTSTCSDDSAEEHNAFEIFINDASSVVANVFQEAASTGDDDASECSTDTDSSEEAEAEAYTDTRAGEPKAKVTFKTKLLGRRAACTGSTEAHNNTNDGETNAMGKFFNNASSAVAIAFQEAASMADDMRTIIATDIDEKSKEVAHDEEQKTVQPSKSKIKVQGSPATATLTEPVQETISCETREDESNEGQPTSSRSRLEVKGSPATLAKLMTKLEKKEKHIKRLKQQLNKAEHEVVETKTTIRALAAKFRGVLNGDVDQTGYDDFVWDEEERDDDAIDLALRYTSSQLSTLEEAANKVIFPQGV
ncbi:hypothetical protein QTG54_000121 [Skeletonema marinoi]|uniref:Uncharacterized protein n=1 Tax=Skeletonema marinoi TaxID=267567 RepID=A0AAD9DI89_9STRA|nr:hypothetical protein QTG54_000121 [Skeletonema marinoi]